MSDIKRQAITTLTPPGPSLDAKDHELAAARLAYLDYVEPILWDLATYVKHKEGILTDTFYANKDDEYFKRSAMNAISELNDARQRGSSGEPWNKFLDPGHAEALKASLYDSHGGDCTAHPFTCMRCYAEEIYRLKSSVTWSKAEGHAMWQATISNHEPAPKNMLRQVTDFLNKYFTSFTK